MYKILIERAVQKQIEKIAEPDYSRIKSAINGLAVNPRPSGYIKLKGRKGYRIRQGNYRIIYEVKDNILCVFILEVGDRKDIYD